MRTPSRNLLLTPALLLPLALGAWSAPTSTASPAAAEDSAALAGQPPAAKPHRVSGSTGDVVPGAYVVALRPRVHARADSLVASWVDRGVQVTRRYDSALTGFAARMSAAEARAVAASPAVAFVEPDRRYSAADTQSRAPWGLDRIDQRSRTLDHRYTYDVAGAGVTAYVIDSGIRRTHVEFGRRVATGFTSVRDGRGTNDCFGHGTHVAGTIGGHRFGVAKAVTIRPVRVLGCRGGGSTSQLIAGVDWVTRHHEGKAPAVANMSLGGPPSRALEAAVRTSVLDGVTYVVAAGNETADACESSPADVGSALTVAASNAKDARASFSNYGGCVDLFAPGTGIMSAFIGGDRATQTLSGTSMAAPHVAGAAVLYLQKHKTASPAQVTDAVVAAGTAGVTGRKGSPDVLLYSKVDRVAPAPVVPPAGNVVANPSFERGPASWAASDYVITDDAFGHARTGNWVAWLGGWGEVHSDTLEQQVTVPTGTAPTLRFSLNVASGDFSDGDYDHLGVQVVTDGGETPPLEFSNLDSAAGYRTKQMDLSAFAGQTVTIRFTSQEDDGGPTSFRIDDVYVTGE